MNLLALLSALRRWWWVLAILLIFTSAAAALRVLRTTAPYQARVMLQLTAPRDVDASVLDTGNPSTSTLRDDLTLVQNDFSTVTGTAEVRRRTVAQLGLQGLDANYSVSVSPVADSNFMIVLVSAANPALAQTIAAAHVAQAIQFLGELRAKPANDTKALLSTQLQAARGALPTKAAASGDAAATADTQNARTAYDALLQKYMQASLVAENAAQASYIQVASPAAALARPTLTHRLISLEELTVVGALGLGGLLIIALEQLLPARLSEPLSVVQQRKSGTACVPPARRFAAAPRFHARHHTNGHQPMVLAKLDADATGSE